MFFITYPSLKDFWILIPMEAAQDIFNISRAVLVLSTMFYLPKYSASICIWWHLDIIKHFHCSEKTLLSSLKGTKCDMHH